jgi:phage tail-like protein
MYTNMGQRRDPYMAYNFMVEIEGLIVGGFSEVSGLGSEIKLHSYEEGGLNTYTHQFPTRTTYTNLVLSRGITESDTLWTWYQQASEGVILLKNGTITLLDSQGRNRLWWHFKQAFPVKWQGPQLNAQNATEVAVQKIELAHQGIYQL